MQTGQRVDSISTVQATDSELVDAWVTLALLRDQAIAGEVKSRGFDTFTACSHAMSTIEIALEQRGGDPMVQLWAALDERKADAQD